MNDNYLFTSERLGFRNWVEEDISIMTAINSDPAVMEFFPGIKNYEETRAFVEKMQSQLTNNGYCYFAVERLEDKAFIGFIGLSEQTYEAFFTPSVDVGWRLGKNYWNEGYATEGAKRCLEYAFHELKLLKVVAVAPKLNIRSEQVMIKIGMQKVVDFIHPMLVDDDRLKECVLYEIENDLL